MTDLPTKGEGTDLATASVLPEGLEDFEVQDMSMPVIQILHEDGLFEDRLSGSTYDALDGVVILGLMKQRVLWPSKIGDGKEKPLCRSYDSKVGYTDDNFPWEASKLTTDSVRQLEVKTDGGGNVFEAACANCNLKEWDTHPSRETPWCTMQHTFALLVNDSGAWVPSLFTIQRSAIKNSNNYLSGFARAQVPMYTQYTNIMLEQRKRGDNTFSVPKFMRAGETNKEDYQFFSQSYADIRSFVQTPRILDEVSPSQSSSPSGPSAPAAPPAAPAPAASAPAPAAPAPAPAEAAPEAAPAPAAAPAAEAPAEPAAAPEAPEAAPEAPVEAAPEAPAAPVNGGPSPAQPAAAAPAADVAELPF